MKISKETKKQFQALALMLGIGVLTGTIRDTQALQTLLEQLLEVVKAENER